MSSIYSMDRSSNHETDSTHQKSKRVRSWYLFEQYKTLKRNQLHAAQKLKERSYQKKLLRQELDERRARRQLCNHFGECQSESQIHRNIHELKTPMSLSIDDFFESVGEFHDSHDDESSENDDVFNKTFDKSEEGTSNRSHSKVNEEFKSVSDLKEEEKESHESITSVVENIRSYEQMADDMKNELEFARKTIKENINVQLDTVEETINAMEEYAKVSGYDSESDKNSRYTGISKKRNCFNKNNDQDDFGMNAVWNHLVSFAYKIVQANHGNCYYDYSSQISTAVLACDVLRRGINAMCYILQPYVCPIKFTSEDDFGSIESKFENINNRNIEKKTRKIERKQHDTKKHRPYPDLLAEDAYLQRHHHSENLWRNCSKYSLEKTNKEGQRFRNSEPWRSAAKITENHRRSNITRKSSTISNSSIWPCENCSCVPQRDVSNPMLKIVGSIEDMRKIDFDTKNV